MPQWPGFIGPSYLSQAVVADTEDLLNWHVGRLESPNAFGEYALFPTPGMQNFASMGGAPNRGLFAQSGRAWTVADNLVKEFFADATMVTRGTVLRDDTLATLTTTGSGGHQLFITSGGHKYILDLISHTFTDVGVGVISGRNVLMGDMLDGFFLALEEDGFSISNNFNGLVWDPTQFAQRSAASDEWKALKVVKNRIYLLGEFTSDVWTNVGTAPFPFAPYGAVIREGIAAPASATEFMGQLAWVAQNRFGGPSVQLADGYTTQKISTIALDQILATYSRVDDAEAFTYSDRGVEFLVLNFPTARATWVYDAQGGWHKRTTWNIAQGLDDAWHARTHCNAFGLHLVGDRGSDLVSKMSTLYYTDFGGAPIRRVRIAPRLSKSNDRIIIDNFTLVMETGVGVPGGQGAEPKIMLQKSQTAGRVWGTERWRTFGKQGAYSTRVRWDRLGSGRDLTVKVTVTDPAPVMIVAALVNDGDVSI